MASLEQVIAGWDTPNGWAALVYDEDTLQILSLSYRNDEPQPAWVAVGLNGFVLPAGQSGGVDMAGLGLYMMPIAKTGAVRPPASIGQRYPA